MTKKRILLVTQYFQPENFKCNDIAFEMQRRGYEVTVLTAIPNYPQGEYFNGYGLFKAQPIKALKKVKEIKYAIRVTAQWKRACLIVKTL